MRFLTIITILLSSSIASAQPPIQEEHWDDDAKLTLAQVLVAEADWNERDHAAIAWVLQKRWNTFRTVKNVEISFASFARQYSAVFKANSARTRTIRAMPWGPAKGRWGGSRWDEVRARVEAWGRGEIVDICPGARHWGGKMDKHPTSRRYGWRVSRCRGTSNIFYEPVYARR